MGDAGYSKNPITAQGITDAFRDAESCVIALDETFSGKCSFDEAMGNYQRVRDEQVLSPEGATDLLPLTSAMSAVGLRWR